MIVKDNVPWSRMLFSFARTGLQESWQRILMATGFAILITYLELCLGLEGYTLTPTPFMILGVAIGIFLGFRNNTAYARFWEGRCLWGGLINAMRSLTRQSLMLLGTRADSRQAEIHERRRTLIYLLIGYVHALRHQLRDSDPLPDVGRYVSADVLARLAERRNLAVALLQEAGELLRQAWVLGDIDTLHLPVFEASLTEITSIQGGCERIKNTPIPYTYVVLSHRVVAFFCFFLPLGLVQTVGIFTPLVVFLVAHAFFGLDVIGEQIESPFDREPHDLPLDAMARTIEIDLLQMLGEKAVPPPVLPDAGRVLL